MFKSKVLVHINFRVSCRKALGYLVLKQVSLNHEGIRVCLAWGNSNGKLWKSIGLFSFEASVTKSQGN